MIGRALNKNYDIYFENGRSAFVQGDDQVRQHLESRFKFFMGEWFLDLNYGVPWYQDIFVKPFNLLGTEAILKTTIIETPEVNNLLTFSSSYSSIGNGILPPRGYGITFSCNTINNSIVGPMNIEI